MRTFTRDAVLNDVRGILRDFNGKEYSGDIGPDTLLFADLGLVSIDAVILAETLEQFYQRTFQFNQFLAEIGREGVRDIRLGRLVGFLNDQLTSQTGQATPCR
jgi:acyl carrier protein